MGDRLRDTPRFDGGARKCTPPQRAESYIHSVSGMTLKSVSSRSRRDPQMYRSVVAFNWNGKITKDSFPHDFLLEPSIQSGARGRCEYPSLLLRCRSTSAHQRGHHVTERIGLLSLRWGQSEEQLSNFIQNLKARGSSSRRSKQVDNGTD